MTREQAKRILQITDAGDPMEIKKNYRKLMAKYHPDTLGSDRSEHMRYAQMINEAYQVLKVKSSVSHRNSGENPGWKRRQTKQQTPAWQGELNAHACCERSIFLHYSMEDAPSDQFYEEARGKYLWNPETEEFPLFLISVRTASDALMSLIEEEISTSEIDSSVLNEIRFTYQKKIFQTMAEQFINPYQVLRHYLKPDNISSDGKEIYMLKGTLAAGCFSKEYKKLTALKEGQLLYPAGFFASRIIVRDVSGNQLGHISFEQDHYYFCLIPLLKANLAQIKIVVKNMALKKRPAQCHVSLQLYIRLEKEAKDSREKHDHGQVQMLLDEYKARLKDEIRN